MVDKVRAELRDTAKTDSLDQHVVLVVIACKE